MNLPPRRAVVKYRSGKAMSRKSWQRLLQDYFEDGSGKSPRYLPDARHQ